jgi:hypothetical protein
MPAYAGVLSDAEIRAVLSYIKSTWSSRIRSHHDQVEPLGAWGPAGFALLYAVGTLLFLPGSIFALGAGALFGPLWGTLVNLTARMLGVVRTFLIARYRTSNWEATDRATTRPRAKPEPGSRPAADAQEPVSYN